MTRATAKTRLSIAKKDVFGLFNTSQQKYFDLKEITKILDKNRDFLEIGKFIKS